MAAPAMDNDSLRRCFLLAPEGAVVATLVQFLAERGIECLWPEDLLRPGMLWSDELTRHLSTADFVVAVVPPSSTGVSIGFELGLAHGLSKPALAIVVGDAAVPHALRELAVVRLSSLDRIQEALPEIDRFLRHARRKTPIRATELPHNGPSDPNWRSRLAELQKASPDERGMLLERLVADAFSHAGADVRTTRNERSGKDDGVDFVVWPDDLVYEIGGPLLIECKAYRDSSGNVSRNAKEAIRRLDRMIDPSGAKLAALVVDHDKDLDMGVLHDTPRVLVFPVEQIIGAVERGSLTEEVLRRRRQAAYTRGRAGAEFVQ